MIDESFKKPGSIPFQWEIEPGIPKENNNINHARLPSIPKLSPPPSLLSLSFTSPATTIFSGSSLDFKGCFSFRHFKLKYDKKSVVMPETSTSSPKLVGGGNGNNSSLLLVANI
ncbi:hypothetical protein IHE45_14G072500 [Dioscorea alata]|uniref:Uncharacterized protein n=1 Tax=Dioscorea alata TaxID=55571 RepID=A0ACB7USR5_DIOAL|nr:hypothetical protein IHE45_14G072500 [Dioscorea alata]